MSGGEDKAPSYYDESEYGESEYESEEDERDESPLKPPKKDAWITKEDGETLG